MNNELILYNDVNVSHIGQLVGCKAVLSFVACNYQLNNDFTVSQSEHKAIGRYLTLFDRQGKGKPSISCGMYGSCKVLTVNKLSIIRIIYVTQGRSIIEGLKWEH